MKYLSIDYGQKRTGLAVSDSTGQMVFALTTLFMKTKEEFFAKLLDIIDKEKIQAVVIGLPVPEDGKYSLSLRQTQNFALRLRRRTTLPLYFMNEELSSFMAEELLRTTGHKKDLRKFTDQVAACIILESFLALPEDDRSRNIIGELHGHKR